MPRVCAAAAAHEGTSGLRRAQAVQRCSTKQASLRSAVNAELYALQGTIGAGMATLSAAQHEKQGPGTNANLTEGEESRKL